MREITDTPAATGFVAGTIVATGDGERAVETLRPGDSVRTAFGDTRCVRWVGRLRESPGPMVRVVADAIAEGVPRRDLILPASHALLLDESLVALSQLVNGSTMIEDKADPALPVFAIELDSHDVLLVEGLPAESFVDRDDRGLYDTVGSEAADAPLPTPWSFCAPRIERSARLEAIQTRLARRAALLERIREGGSPVVGHVDELQSEFISGWAVDTSEPTRPVALDIMVDGAPAGRIVADQLRLDVERAGYGAATVGFTHRFAPPLSPFEPHEVLVRITGTRSVLTEGARLLSASTHATPSSIAQFAGALEATAASRGDTDHALRLLTGISEAFRAARAGPVGDSSEDRDRKLALVLDDKLPDPSRDAGAQAIASHVASLVRLGFRVIYIPTDRAEGTCPALDLPHVTRVGREGARSVEDALRQHGGEAALVYVHRLSNMSRYGAVLPIHCPHARIAYCVADLHFLRMRRQAELTQDLDMQENSRRTAERELLAASLAHVVITHSTYEAEVLRRSLPRAEIRVVPWKIGGRAGTTTFRQRRGLAFIGGASHKPNLDAARIIVHEIMPRLARAGHAVPVTLVGAGLEAALDNPGLPDLTFIEYIPSLSEVLDAVRLTIAPIRFGAGVKGKVVQSYAYGVPCVTSTIGAEGLDLPQELAVTVAKNIDEMEAAIMRLHEDEALHQACAKASRAFAEKHFSARAVDEALGAAVLEPRAVASRRGEAAE